MLELPICGRVAIKGLRQSLVLTIWAYVANFELDLHKAGDKPHVVVHEGLRNLSAHRGTSMDLLCGPILILVGSMACSLS